MPPRTFLDTNVFVYAADSSDPRKQARASEILMATTGIVVSTQVINEFYVVVTRKLKPPVPERIAADAAERMTRYVCVAIDADLALRAISAGRRWQLSHWDALMIEAARQAACGRMLSEDLANGSTFDGIRIENPFATTA
jgi:predicted nucleic acid-binding protein